MEQLWFVATKNEKRALPRRAMGDAVHVKAHFDDLRLAPVRLQRIDHSAFHRAHLHGKESLRLGHC